MLQLFKGTFLRGDGWTQALNQSSYISQIRDRLGCRDLPRQFSTWKEKVAGHWGHFPSLWFVNKARGEEQSWETADWLTPLPGSVRAAKQDFSWEDRLRAGGSFGGQSVCQLSVPSELLTNINIYYYLLGFLSVSFMSSVSFTTSSGFFLYAVSPFLFDRRHQGSFSFASSVLHSSPPSFKCWWAVEQNPGGHGDRQPPSLAHFLLLSWCLQFIGSYTLLTSYFHSWSLLDAVLLPDLTMWGTVEI